MRASRKCIKTAAWILVCGLLWMLPMPSALAAEGQRTLGESTARLQACDSNGNTNVETNFGNFTADAMCWFAQADIALLPSGDLGNHLQEGPITEAALADCLQRNAMLARTQLSSAQLYTYLEHGISHISLNEDETINWEASWFAGYLQISGISVAYNVAAPIGERVMELYLSDGTQLAREDESTRFLVVSTQELLSGSYGYPQAENIETLDSEQAAITAYVSYLETVSIPENGGRTQILGTRDFWENNGRLIGALIALAGLIIIVPALGARRKKKEPWGSVPRGY